MKIPMISKTVTVPDTSEVFFVGDIHGGYDYLLQALDLAGFDPDKDYLFSVGDLIDRGPDNLKVLAKFIYDNTGRYHAVMGNHDAFAANPYEDRYCWIMNGGSWAIDLCPEELEPIQEDIRQALPIFIKVLHRGKTYGVVHGGFTPHFEKSGLDFSIPDWNDTVEHLESCARRFTNTMSLWDKVYPYLWDREAIKWVMHFLESKDPHDRIPGVDGVDYVVHGHTPTKQPLRFANRVWIDTGGYKGTFTILKSDLSYVTSPNPSKGGDPIKGSLA